jgi:hypothetical protein
MMMMMANNLVVVTIAAKGPPATFGIPTMTGIGHPQSFGKTVVSTQQSAETTGIHIGE